VISLQGDRPFKVQM